MKTQVFYNRIFFFFNYLLRSPWRISWENIQLLKNKFFYIFPFCCGGKFFPFNGSHFDLPGSWTGFGFHWTNKMLIQNSKMMRIRPDPDSQHYLNCWFVLAGREPVQPDQPRQPQARAQLKYCTQVCGSKNILAWILEGRVSMAQRLSGDRCGPHSFSCLLIFLQIRCFPPTCYEQFCSHFWNT